jgi:hypothetical protein
MSRLAPRIAVSLLVTLLLGPLSSTAHDSDDKRAHDSDDKTAPDSDDKRAHDSDDKTAHDSDDKRAHDSDDKNSEGKWSVIVAGHITWTGEDHRDCVHRATATSGQCVRMHPQQGASNQDCPEVTPGLQAPAAGRGNWRHCFIRTEHDSDR